MEQISNQPIAENEFARWLSELEKNHLDVMTQAQAKEKENLLKFAEEYIVTDADINKMVEQNRALNKARLNVASEKVAFLNQRDAAKDSGDMEEYERCCKQIEELDALLAKSKNTTSEDKTSRINQRNKYANVATKYEVAKVADSNDLHDPFSRRQTKPSPTFMKPKSSEEENNENKGTNGNNHEPAKLIITEPVIPIEPDHPENQLKFAHDFDLELTVPKTTIIEASKTSSALINPFIIDRPKAALSVNDYKMRRGLI